METSDLSLKPGAVALVDALGFKGIWKRNDVAKLLATLHRCRERMLKRCEGFRRAFGADRDISVNIGVFSDNVIVAARLEGDRVGPEDTSDCVGIVAAMIADLQIAALETDVRLAFRGCIAAGQVYADEHFIVGEAVDRAAQHMELADGAFVWCLPDDAYKVDSAESFHLFVDYEVPLRDGRRIQAQVVNPFAAIAQHRQIAAQLAGEATIARSFLSAGRDLERLLMKTFSAGVSLPDVTIKRQNTRAFLDWLATSPGFEQEGDNHE